MKINTARDLLNFWQETYEVLTSKNCEKFLNHPDLKRTYGHLSQIYRQINNESIAMEYEMKKLKK